jgi:hypothetical protein
MYFFVNCLKAGVIDEATAQKTEVDDAFNKAIHDFGIGL